MVLLAVKAITAIYVVFLEAILIHQKKDISDEGHSLKNIKYIFAFLLCFNFLK